MINNPRVSIVNYNNTKPLLFGLERANERGDITLSYDYPTMVARSLQYGSVDIALVPVASIPIIPDATIFGHYGIASRGPVASVCIFSHVPLSDIDSLYLDYQSMTSIRLAHIIMQSYGNDKVSYVQASEGYIDNIKGATAGVVIGDRALRLLDKYPFVYDLGQLWTDLTSLPFVYALWVSRVPLTKEFITSFDQWNGEGLESLEQVISQVDMPYYDPKRYFTENINYKIGDQEIEGLSLFFQKINPTFNLTFDR